MDWRQDRRTRLNGIRAMVGSLADAERKSETCMGPLGLLTRKMKGLRHRIP